LAVDTAVHIRLTEALVAQAAVVDMYMLELRELQGKVMPVDTVAMVQVCLLPLLMVVVLVVAQVLLEETPLPLEEVMLTTV
jgi:hypothetical protein